MAMTQEERNAEDALTAAKQKEYEDTRKYIDDRVKAYPNIGDQLDAIWKELNKRRLSGDNLVQDADDMLGKILSVKAKHPKP